MLGFGAIAKKLFGSANDRKVKTASEYLPRINALEAELSRLSDADLAARTPTLKGRLAAGETLDDILPDAFATVREAAKRALGMRHFDVQMVGGVVLHQGGIAEMKTGEGKTLVATLPVYLNALTGKGVHVITVNDYLAGRDAEWMGKVYAFLGLSVGCIVHGIDDAERRAAYVADVTYGTNNEFGFDYLRDNMKYALDQMVQRGHNYAIVDEVDSILVDEARTPLIISGPTEDHSDLYRAIDVLIPRLAAEHYDIDEKARSVSLNEDGNEAIEGLLREAELMRSDSLYDVENVTLVHHVNQSLRAHKLFTRDKDYIVRNDQVVIIDEFTGRMMPGRRYSEGLHQSLEAKEGVTVQPENQTLASITFQNFFRLYDKLAGMTGTAATEADEFMDIYKLDVVEVPTNVEVTRIDEDDVVYRTGAEKFRAIVEELKDAHARGQPVLVGTASIERSEHLADMLKAAKIPHNVLNARYHEQEATIIAQAGRPGAVTIATNMAGRGTDIQLGGNAEMAVAAESGEMAEGGERDAKIAEVRARIEADRQIVLKAGGLYVLGTERHESRRIDNQLRGRSGRQGDPGRSVFFLSLEDDLMRIFGSERMDKMLRTLGIKEDEAIVHPWINKALEKAQKKVEARNFDIRKNLLKYDDVMNDQRKAIFEQRIDFMRAEDVQDIVGDMRAQMLRDLVRTHVPENAYAEQWDSAGLKDEVKKYFGLDLPVPEWAAEEGIADEELLERLEKAADEKAAKKASDMGPPLMRHIEKTVLLSTLDQHWREHLVMLDHLRQVIGLRGYAQRDPLNEFKTEAFTMFESLLSRLRQDVTGALMNVELAVQPPEPQAPDPRTLETHHMDPLTGEDDAVDLAKRPTTDPSTWGKVPRNAQCPCGSGKKYKHCHGALG